MRVCVLVRPTLQLRLSKYQDEALELLVCSVFWLDVLFFSDVSDLVSELLGLRLLPLEFLPE
jgi:hypothetical protein